MSEACDTITELDVMNGKDKRMILESNRLLSFKNWPFNDSVCNKHAMASAGFYHCNIRQEPDSVRCFCCFKELDGWQKNDNPWNEHRDHQNDCFFIKVGKTESQMTIKEFIEVIQEREVNLLKKVCDYKKKEEKDKLIQLGLIKK